ncbi:lymphocyte antigen 6D-like isoform X2 [Macrotis lagotis]|uniref:lymphocyte antigen 6D-like isoform X2 n=1 Tax=Macrotis lagotis TaxID=92651 RepID=UPI003D6911E7
MLSSSVEAGEGASLLLPTLSSDSRFPQPQENSTMPGPASPKRMIYSCKKIMLMIILVFSRGCLWPAQALECHSCNNSETCFDPKTCAEDETVCILEILKLSNYTAVNKKCSSTCEAFTLTRQPLPNTELSKNNFWFRLSKEYTIVCCDRNLCNQAKVRGPGATALISGLLLSLLWLIYCLML